MGGDNAPEGPFPKTFSTVCLQRWYGGGYGGVEGRKLELEMELETFTFCLGRGNS